MVKRLCLAAALSLLTATTAHSALSSWCNWPSSTTLTEEGPRFILRQGDWNKLQCIVDGLQAGGGGGSGTVTSVDVSGGTTGLSASGGPITTSGTITLAGTLVVANGGTGATTESGARTNLGLAIGTDVQAFDAFLLSIGALGTASDKIIYTTGVDTAAETGLSAFMRTVLDDTTSAAARATLEVSETTCLDAGVDCLFAGSASEGGPATSALTATNADNLTLDPSDCAASNFATSIDRQADLGCAQPAFTDLSGVATDAQVPNTITVDLAATVTTNANLEGPVTSSGNTTTITADSIGTSQLDDAADTPLAGECVVVASDTTKIEYNTCPTDGVGYATVEDEDTPLTQRSALNFEGAGISCADDGGTKTTCTVAGEGSGVITGGVISINGGDNTKFDISAGTGRIVDYWTTPGSPVVYEIALGSTAVPVTNIATQTVTFVAVDSAGDVQQFANPLTPQQRRSHIFIGQLGHANNTNIATAVPFPDIAASTQEQLLDLVSFLGTINDGVRVTANGATLELARSSGTLYKPGANYAVDDEAPSQVAISTSAPLSFRLRTQTGSGATGATTLDVGNYDLSGTITSIIGVKWQNFRVYQLTSGNTVIQYGQSTYSTSEAAFDGITSEPFVLLANLKDAVLIGIISAKSNATDLTNGTQAIFYSVGRFGQVAGAGGVAAANLAELVSYDNTVSGLTATNVQAAIDEVSAAGVTDHTALSNLAWTSSGHTGTANHVPYFDGGGAAASSAGFTYDGTTLEVVGEIQGTSLAIDGNNDSVTGPRILYPLTGGLSVVDDGTSVVNDNYSGVVVDVENNPSTGSNQVTGQTIFAAGGGANVSYVSGLDSFGQAVAGTVPNVYGGFFATGVQSGATATNVYGLRVGTVGGTGTKTTVTGLSIAAQTAGATNWAIRSDGGQSYHVGNLRIGDTLAPTVALDVTGGVAASGTITGSVLKVLPAALFAPTIDFRDDTDSFSIYLTGVPTGSNILTLPDATGTLALTSDIPSSYETVEDEDTPLTQRSALNFEGAGVTCADDGGTKTTCTITSGGTADHTGLSNLAWTSSGHTGTAGAIAGFTGGVASEFTTTGTGTVLALQTSPQFVTPEIDAATGTSLDLSENVALGSDGMLEDQSVLSINQNWTPTSSDSFYGVNIQADIDQDSGGPSSVYGAAVTVRNTLTTVGSTDLVGGFFDVSAGSGTTADEVAGVVAYAQSAGTVTTQYGVSILSTVAAGTTNVGLRIGDVSGATNNWAIQSAGGDSYHVGDLRIGSTTAPTAALDVTGAAKISSTLNVTGAITGNLTGNADTATSATSATNATNIGVLDASSDTTTWPLLARTQTGTQGAKSDGGLSYNASTNHLSVGIAPRDTGTTSGTPINPNTTTDDLIYRSAMTGTHSINNPSGTAVEGQKLMFRFQGNGSAQTITWSGTQYRGGTDIPLSDCQQAPATSYIYCGFIWNSSDSKWDLIAVAGGY